MGMMFSQGGRRLHARARTHTPRRRGSQRCYCRAVAKAVNYTLSLFPSLAARRESAVNLLRQWAHQKIRSDARAELAHVHKHTRAHTEPEWLNCCCSRLSFFLVCNSSCSHCGSKSTDKLWRNTSLRRTAALSATIWDRSVQWKLLTSCTDAHSSQNNHDL